MTTMTTKQKRLVKAHRRQVRAARAWRKMPWWDRVARAGVAHLAGIGGGHG